MKRIDFLGASGAGKSAVFHELEKISGRKKLWLTPKEAKTAVARYYMKQNRRSSKDYKAAIMLGLPFFKPFHAQAASYLLSARSTELLWDNAQNHSAFLNTVLKGASFEERDALHRLLGINWLVPVYRDVLLMENCPLEKIVAFAESLSQKIYGITHWQKGAFEEITAAYFNSIPLPAGLVHFKLASETAFERLKKRPKVTTGQRNMTDAELFNVIDAQIEIADMGAGIIKARGVKVLELNSDSSLDQKASYINRFIAAL